MKGKLGTVFNYALDMDECQMVCYELYISRAKSAVIWMNYGEDALYLPPEGSSAVL